MSDVDYRDTVFLPATDFPMRGSLPVKEPDILARWQKIGLYQQIRKKSKGKELFILHDGPPYANGNIHVGHAVNKILKDVVVRTRQMLGFDAPYVPGWDCHGLPIEWKIEEGYRLKGLDKDQVPVLQFRSECRAFADKWFNVQRDEFQRLGVVGDWQHPYLTMSKKAEAQILREIHKFLLNGLLYKGVKPVMWSVVEKTALAEAEIEYQDHKSTTLWVKFPVTTPSSSLRPFGSVCVVIWTTTPWTIPANRAIAYGDFSYTLLEVQSVAEGSLAQVGDKLIVATDLLDSFCKDTKIVDTMRLATLTNADLDGMICAHPFRGKEGCDGYFNYDVPLHRGEFVTTEAGTGFVHIAPGHGVDDFNLGRQKKIAFDETVGDDGVYLPQVKGFAGLSVYKPDGKEGEANGAVIKALMACHALLAKKNILHSYPHSWRSKAPLIFRTTPQWFISMDKAIEGKTESLRSLALESIAATTWFPEIGENRIAGMVSSRPDWCISRQRAWGVPIALFVSKKDGTPLKDPAVLERIAQAFDEEGADAWYQHDAAFFLGDKYQAADFDRVFDIVDVWFESGATHSFCLNQAHGTEWPELQWPADLYLEGSDQHRGWFHSSLLEACGTMGRAPYQAVLTHGFALDEQGRKQSKSLGNVVAPQDVFSTMGADILRLWVLSSDYTQDICIGPNILKQMGDLYRRLRNTLRYLLGALSGISPAEQVAYTDLPELERWVLARLYETDTDIRAAIAEHKYNTMLQVLHHFCAMDLSSFYFDIRKDCLYCDEAQSTKRRAARMVLSILFDHLVVWLAPILAFTAEEAYLARHGDAQDHSVHLLTFPHVPEQWAQTELLSKWQDIRAIRRVVTGAMEQARSDKKIGSSLQAHPVLYVTDDVYALVGDMDFSEICIASSVSIKKEAAPETAYTLPDEKRVAVDIRVATGQKCERCWQVLETVVDDLCPRCLAAVQQSRRSA